MEDFLQNLFTLPLAIWLGHEKKYLQPLQPGRCYAEGDMKKNLDFLPICCIISKTM